ncbi:ribosome small subunit-dependent GTPase A [Tenuibacillus multivorans]|uniref:Small ribosomal subunit biogenesis GTPase RsgA n=1 Tax=Tenuibacillus multivorans TaxID=237069 RepID=A0A1G9Y2M6_9BACI|nr:ribosome small subunit-dependent GTPase A [Tenuibacillus multivorans]GEL75923.1 putative ribosome biogenesis GTPase RsgA [Tenuibacillus multivorans]SDN03307.1 ribosome biogenesis GTPase [Tenuibacillus multivorans]
MGQGIIVKALSGFYDVLIGEDVYSCKGRGLFRKKKITPLVGDRVEIETQPDGTGTIIDIQKRQNELVRPPIANVDQVIMVSSVVEPEFNPLLLDRFLTLIEFKNIDPLIILTKKDLASDDQLSKLEDYVGSFQQIGYKVLLVSKHMDQLEKMVLPYLNNKLSVIAGQSGVGKSSMLNGLNEQLNIATGDISKSLGRGKHTTRHVELFQLGGGFVADTPGFSSLDFNEVELEDLRFCFKEFVEVQDQCKFRGCLHMNEPKCAVKDAVEEGTITPFRYEHYQSFYEEIKSRKPRYS